jgi:hypothetical protein
MRFLLINFKFNLNYEGDTTRAPILLGQQQMGQAQGPRIIGRNRQAWKYQSASLLLEFGIPR